MKSAINKEEVLPNEMIRDILVANPQSAVADDVLEQLNNRFVPMPENMLEDILEGQDVLSPKDELEANLAARKLAKAVLLGELIRYYQDDTLQPDVTRDSLLSLFLGENSVESKYHAAFEYLNDSALAEMNSVIDAIPSQLPPAGEEEERYDDYKTYLALLESLTSQGRSIFELTMEEINVLTDLSHNSTEPVCTYAMNLFEVITGNCYRELVLIPDELKSAPQKLKIRTSPVEKGEWIRLFPNPAKQYVIVAYNYTDLVKPDDEIALFTVISAEGKVVENRILSKPQDQFLLNTGTYGKGIYIFTIKTAGKIVGASKLTVID